MLEALSAFAVPITVLCLLVGTEGVAGSGIQELGHASAWGGFAPRAHWGSDATLQSLLPADHFVAHARLQSVADTNCQSEVVSLEKCSSLIARVQAQLPPSCTHECTNQLRKYQQSCVYAKSKADERTAIDEMLKMCNSKKNKNSQFSCKNRCGDWARGPASPELAEKENLPESCWCDQYCSTDKLRDCCSDYHQQCETSWNKHKFSALSSAPTSPTFQGCKNRCGEEWNPVDKCSCSYDLCMRDPSRCCSNYYSACPIVATRVPTQEIHPKCFYCRVADASACKYTKMYDEDDLVLRDVNRGYELTQDGRTVQYVEGLRVEIENLCDILGEENCKGFTCWDPVKYYRQLAPEGCKDPDLRTYAKWQLCSGLNNETAQHPDWKPPVQGEPADPAAYPPPSQEMNPAPRTYLYVRCFCCKPGETCTLAPTTPGPTTTLEPSLPPTTSTPTTHPTTPPPTPTPTTGFPTTYPTTVRPTFLPSTPTPTWPPTTTFPTGYPTTNYPDRKSVV